MPLPQLSTAETEYFKSGGTVVADSLKEGLPAAPATPVKGHVETEVPRETIEKPTQAIEETSEQKQAKAAKEAEDAAKAEREKKRKEAIEGLGLVPLEALQEARNESKLTKRQLEELQAWKQQIEPTLKALTPAATIITNPYEPGTPNHIAWEAADPEQKRAAWEWESQKKDIAEFKNWRQNQELNARNQQQIQQVTNWAIGKQAEFEKTQPAYKDAYAFASKARHAELEALGYSDPAQRENMINADQAQIVLEAARRTQAGTLTNPAELIYNYAIAKGFKVKAAEDKTAAALEKIAAGQAAAGGLNGGTAPKGEMTLDDLARMPIRTPDQRAAYDVAWKKLMKA